MNLDLVFHFIAERDSQTAPAPLGHQEREHERTFHRQNDVDDCEEFMLGV